MTVAWKHCPAIVRLDGFDFDVKAEVDRAERLLPDHARIDFTSAQAAELQGALFAVPLFSPPRLIVLWEANKLQGAYQTMLQKYCEKGGLADTVLVLVSSGRVASWYRGLQFNEQETFSAPKPWEISDWVALWARNQGYDLAIHLAQALVQNVGDDPYALTSELTKAFVLMGKRKVIEASDLTRLLVQHESLKPWLIVDAWAARKSVQADRMLTLYLHQTKDAWALLPVITLLLKRCQQLLTYVSAHKVGMSDGEISKMLGVKGKTWETLTSQGAAWDVVSLRRAYIELCEVEVAAKMGGPADQRLHLFMYQDLTENQG